MKQKLRLLRISTYLLCAMFVMNSCNSSGNKTESATTDTTAATTAPAPAPAAQDTTTAAATPAKLTDPEIASVAVTADQIDIDYAAIAKKISKNKAVLEFAATMAKDHGNVNKQAVALAKKLGVTPKDNPTTQSLLAQAATTKDMLNSKTGADFDKAYIDNEVAYHKAAIGVVENTLIPDATNPELKSLLQSALPIFKGHLEHAEKIQADLSK
jgi:putative membrane protein